MSSRELILLSPYRLPAKNTLMLGNEDVASFLNGYMALWHPAAALDAVGPPSISSPYDHENPKAGCLYAVPESPPMFLPDDWDERVAQAGAAAFRSGADREATFINLLNAVRELKARQSEKNAGAAEPEGQAPSGPLLELTPEQVAPFLGIGFGYVHVEALFEAMEHENLLATSELWDEVQQATRCLAQADAEGCRSHLQAAADKLMTAREVLYPTGVRVVDIGILDEKDLLRPLPASFDKDLPLNLVASSSLLEKMEREQPDRMAAIRDRVHREQVEICGGPYLEREDALLPLESQLSNLLKGTTSAREILGRALRIYSQQRISAHPQLPTLLNQTGLHRALLVAFDDAVIPSFRGTVVSWSAPDGKSVETFARAPYKADDPQTYFHVAHYLHKTIMEDNSATLALLHKNEEACPWYQDWLELARFGPVLGQWTTLNQYLNDVLAVEYTSASSADDFHADYLSARTDAHLDNPVSQFARHARARRRLDAVWSLAAMHRGLAGTGDALNLTNRLEELEGKMEQGAEVTQEILDAQKTTLDALANRLLAKAPEGVPGYLVVNPCSFARRVPAELEGIKGPLPLVKPVRACQMDGDKAKLVLEIPALGFAWFPKVGAAGTPAQASRMRLADERHVRNEFFEAEIDPGTGGLRGIWDPRSRVSRLGQQLVFNPGSAMRAKEVKVISTGPALGEVISEGAILNDQNEVLASYRQRFRAWLGRPILDLRIDIFPQNDPDGYPWHSYYGARFAWRDERALLLRGVNGTSYITNHTRPESADYLEIRLGRQNTLIFPGGIPFHQRHGARMLDVILVPPGEKTHTFDLAIGLDRELPMHTALGLVSPAPMIETAKGPPHVGTTGWLFHLDVPNLLLTSMRPAPDGADAIVARMLECGIQGGQAEFRCPRDPKRAVLLDARGESLVEATTSTDAAFFEVAQGDLVQLRLEFS